MASASHGLTLLETMIALTILVITIMGVNETISIAMQRTASLYYYRLALLQQKNLLEMRDAHHGGIDSEMIAIWNQQIAEVLPNGRGTISGADDVRVYWNKDDKLL